MEFIFIVKFISNPLKTNLILGILLGSFPTPNDMVWFFFGKVGSRLKGTMRKAKG
jgi:hypothetical protein